MIGMIVCQKCYFLMKEDKYGYYFCPKCGEITYFIEFVFKC